MNTIEKRSIMVCDTIMKLLSNMMEQAQLDKWDGREFFIGTGLAFRAFCSKMRITPDQAVGILKRLEVPNQEADDSLIKVVQPNGRPIGEVDK